MEFDENIIWKLLKHNEFTENNIDKMSIIIMNQIRRNSNVIKTTRANKLKSLRGSDDQTKPMPNQRFCTTNIHWQNRRSSE